MNVFTRSFTRSYCSFRGSYFIRAIENVFPVFAYPDITPLFCYVSILNHRQAVSDRTKFCVFLQQMKMRFLSVFIAAVIVQYAVSR